MELWSILTAKPVLIGIHLGAAIFGIDAFMWLLGKLTDQSSSRVSRVYPALIGSGAFLVSWIVGGYYYVTTYGSLVKPIIKAGSAPWAHGIVMESKEHIFLFLLPLTVTLVFLVGLEPRDLARWQLDTEAKKLTMLVVGIGLLLGAMGFIISSAARWGV